MGGEEVLVVYADGVLDVLNLGVNVAVTLFAWERGTSGNVEKCPILRLVMPKHALDMRSIAEMAESQPVPVETAVLGS